MTIKEEQELFDRVYKEYVELTKNWVIEIRGLGVSQFQSNVMVAQAMLRTFLLVNRGMELSGDPTFFSQCIENMKKEKSLIDKDLDKTKEKKWEKLN